MSSKRETRILTLGDKLGAAIATPDRQANGLRDLEIADESFVQAFNQHFAGTSVLEDREKVRAATLLRNSIKRGTDRQLDAIIDMGRALLRAEQIFTKWEWNHLLEGGPRLLGLPKNTASMYRAIARNIDDGRLPREVCPESFSTAYVLTTFEDWQLAAAREQGLLRPTVTRREVEEFKRLPPPEQMGAQRKVEPADETAVLREEERVLRKRERRLLDDLASVQGRLEQIKTQLSKNPFHNG